MLGITTLKPKNLLSTAFLGAATLAEKRSQATPAIAQTLTSRSASPAISAFLVLSGLSNGPENGKKALDSLSRAPISELDFSAKLQTTTFTP